jgi:hypothetical protein
VSHHCDVFASLLNDHTHFSNLLTAYENERATANNSERLKQVRLRGVRWRTIAPDCECAAHWQGTRAPTRLPHHTTADPQQAHPRRQRAHGV